MHPFSFKHVPVLLDAKLESLHKKIRLFEKNPAFWRTVKLSQISDVVHEENNHPQKILEVIFWVKITWNMPKPRTSLSILQNLTSGFCRNTTTHCTRTHVRVWTKLPPPSFFKNPARSLESSLFFVSQRHRLVALQRSVSYTVA